MCVAQIALELGPTPRRTRNNQCHTREVMSAMFSLDGTYLRCKTKFPAREISPIFFNTRFTRGLLQLPFSQAARRVTLSVHTLILAFQIEGKKELKALHNALASRTLISPSRSTNNLVFAGTASSPNTC